MVNYGCFVVGGGIVPTPEGRHSISPKDKPMLTDGNQYYINKKNKYFKKPNIFISNSIFTFFSVLTTNMYIGPYSLLILLNRVSRLIPSKEAFSMVPLWEDDSLLYITQQELRDVGGSKKQHSYFTF